MTNVQGAQKKRLKKLCQSKSQPTTDTQYHHDSRIFTQHTISSYTTKSQFVKTKEHNNESLIHFKSCNVEIKSEMKTKNLKSPCLPSINGMLVHVLRSKFPNFSNSPSLNPYHRLNFLCSSNASSCIWNLVNFSKYDGDQFIKQSPLKFRHLKPKASSFDVRKPDETPTTIDKRNPILYPNKNLDLSQTKPKPHTWSCRKEIAVIQSCWEYGAGLKTTKINQCGFQVCAVCRSAGVLQYTSLPSADLHWKPYTKVLLRLRSRFRVELNKMHHAMLIIIPC